MRKLIFLAALVSLNVAAADSETAPPEITPRNATAPASFKIESRGDAVCKIEAGGPEPLCYRRANSPDVWPTLPEQIELVAKVKRLKELAPDGKLEQLDLKTYEEFAPAYLLRAEDRDFILQTYRTIEVSDIGLDTEHITKSPAQSEIPFLVNVKWQTLDGQSGTLGVQGLAVLPTDLALENKELGEAMSELVHLGVVTESVPPPPWPGDPAQASVRFLGQVLGPGVGGGYFVLPIAGSFVEGIAKIFEEVGKSIGNSLNAPTATPETSPEPAPAPQP